MGVKGTTTKDSKSPLKIYVFSCIDINISVYIDTGLLVLNS